MQISGSCNTAVYPYLDPRKELFLALTFHVEQWLRRCINVQWVRYVMAPALLYCGGNGRAYFRRFSPWNLS